MSGWDYDDAGKFGSEKAAEDFAKANNIDPSDIRTRRKGESVELEIRRSALVGRRGGVGGAAPRDGWN
jgi:hypothetical protein